MPTHRESLLSVGAAQTKELDRQTPDRGITLMAIGVASIIDHSF